MWEKKRYHQMLFMIDTCQANTMYSKFYSPNILATGSSKLDQSSYSHHADNDVGVAVIDRYTYYNLEFMENNVQNASSKHTMQDLFDSYDVEKIHSEPGIRTDLFPYKLDEVLITDFFGNVQNVEVDGEGEETKWRVDVAELSRLAANLSHPLAKTDTAQNVMNAVNHITSPIASKNIGAVRVEEQAGWNMAGIGAMLVCVVAWMFTCQIDSR